MTERKKLNLEAPVDLDALHAHIKEGEDEDIHFKQYPPSPDTLNKQLD